ncbi:hypothetical protein [Bacteriovorax sp. Seq25_V]|uniref:hypothetical protein n=1 Tax=Bacteriovorax sp. Seq25_V TaxID=1201288 RepID=UPI0018E0411D|nr:hypothetical protein [Bacteriovorax sp. Seq25_V]
MLQIFIILFSLLSCSSPQKREYEEKTVFKYKTKIPLLTDQESKDCLRRREDLTPESKYASIYKETIKKFPQEKRKEWAYCQYFDNASTPKFDRAMKSNLYYESMINLYLLTKVDISLLNTQSYFDFDKNKIITFQFDKDLPTLPDLFSINELIFFEDNFIGYFQKIKSKDPIIFSHLYLTHLQYYLFVANEFKNKVLHCDNISMEYPVNRLLESALIVKLYLLRLEKFYPQKYLTLTAQAGFSDYIDSIQKETAQFISFFNNSKFTCTIERKKFDVLYKEYINAEKFAY